MILKNRPKGRFCVIIKIMKKTILTIIGLAIILVIPLWLFPLSPRASIAPTPAATSPALVAPAQPLTLSRILNSNGFVNGGKNVDAPGEQYIPKEQIVFGDLDRDGVREAVAPVLSCGASCGQSVYVFKFDHGAVIMSEIPGTAVAGAAQKVNSLKIKDGSVVVTETDFDGARTNTYHVKFMNGEIVVQ